MDGLGENIGCTAPVRTPRRLKWVLHKLIGHGATRLLTIEHYLRKDWCATHMGQGSEFSTLGDTII